MTDGVGENACRHTLPECPYVGKRHSSGGSLSAPNSNSASAQPGLVYMCLPMARAEEGETGREGGENRRIFLTDIDISTAVCPHPIQFSVLERNLYQRSPPDTANATAWDYDHKTLLARAFCCARQNRCGSLFLAR